MTNREIIQNLILKTPQYSKRKFRFIVISKILEENHNIILEPYEIQLICSLVDEFRHQTEADETGLKLADEWKSQSQRIYEQEEKRILKQKLL